MDSATPSAEPRAIAPEAALERADENFWAEPPAGHFWLEHLARALAGKSPASMRPWEMFGVTDASGNVAALYARNTESGYAMFHATHPPSGGKLLTWALAHAPPQKALATESALQKSVEAAGLGGRITRDHRELFLTLPLGALAVEPDWNYRLATKADIPRLERYNRLYNEERRTTWAGNWAMSVQSGAVYVRERGGVIASCLMRGALLPPRISFGGAFTFPEYRGMGDATMLVANFCAEAAMAALDVCLLVDDDNPAAIRVYGKVGFIPQGLYRTVYFD